MVDADPICDIGDMFDDPTQRRVRIVSAIGAGVAGFEIDADQSA